MIIKEVCFVTPSSPAVIMVGRRRDEDPTLLAREQAEAFTDTIYFEIELLVEGTTEEDDWPDLTWMNWYGKMVTSNLYACYDVPGNLVEQCRFTENELKWFLNTNSNTILFLIGEGLMSS